MNRLVILGIALIGVVVLTRLAETGVNDPPLTAVEIVIILPEGTDPENPVVEVGELVLYVAQITGGQGMVEFDWDFGDAATIHNGDLVEHTYAEAAVCTVGVYAIDTLEGEVVGTAYDELIVTVEDPSVHTDLSTWGRIKALFFD